MSIHGPEFMPNFLWTRPAEQVVPGHDYFVELPALGEVIGNNVKA